MSDKAYTAERFFLFSRQRMAALLGIVVLLGGSALALMLSTGATFDAASILALVAVVTVLLALLVLAVAGRRWRDDAHEVRVVMDDELRHANLLRASRVAFITALAAQVPFQLLFGLVFQLPAPRGAFAMGTATVTLGLATLLAVFLWTERD